MTVHAAVAAALAVVPAATVQRFASSGQQQVISLAASRAAPSSVVSTSPEIVTPPFVEPESHEPVPVEKVATTEPPERLDAAVSDSVERQPSPVSVPSVNAPPPASPYEASPRRPQPRPRLQLPQRHSAPPLPEIASTDLPERPRRQFQTPPMVSATPVQPLAGLNDREAADLSSNPPPDYPAEAIRQRWEGVVLLQLRIASTGQVEGVEIIESSGHRLLDEAAVTAVAQWQGRPARRWGRPVESAERLPIRFRL